MFRKRLFAVMLGIATLVITPLALNAQEEEALGSVYVSVTYGSATSGGLSPLQMQMLPGSGQAVATAGIEWRQLRIDAIAISELQGAGGRYNIFARVQTFTRNGVLKCSQSSLTGLYGQTNNASWSTRCNVFEGPFGATWANTTEHLFQGSNPPFSWNPSVFVSQSI